MTRIPSTYNLPIRIRILEFHGISIDVHCAVQFIACEKPVHTSTDVQIGKWIKTQKPQMKTRIFNQQTYKKIESLPALFSMREQRWSNNNNTKRRAGIRHRGTRNCNWCSYYVRMLCSHTIHQLRVEEFATNKICSCLLILAICVYVVSYPGMKSHRMKWNCDVCTPLSRVPSQHTEWEGNKHHCMTANARTRAFHIARAPAHCRHDRLDVIKLK